MMERGSIEKAIRDCGLPGRLVEVDGKLIVLDVLNDRLERLERHELGMSQFCDLLLDWRQRLVSRDPESVAAAKVTRAQGSVAGAEAGVS